MNQDFTGKTVLVTGATSGIGKATAELIAASGGTVIATGRQAANLPGHENIVPLPGDLTDATFRDQLAKAAAEAGNGRLDALVNAAGIIGTGTVETTSLEAFVLPKVFSEGYDSLTALGKLRVHTHLFNIANPFITLTLLYMESFSALILWIGIQQGLQFLSIYLSKPQLIGLSFWTVQDADLQSLWRDLYCPSMTTALHSFLHLIVLTFIVLSGRLSNVLMDLSLSCMSSFCTSILALSKLRRYQAVNHSLIPPSARWKNLESTMKMMDSVLYPFLTFFVGPKAMMFVVDNFEDLIKKNLVHIMLLTMVLFTRTLSWIQCCYDRLKSLYAKHIPA